jgi:hypothetical protein
MNLKDQFNAMMLQRSGRDLKDNPFGALGMALASTQRRTFHITSINFFDPGSRRVGYRRMLPRKNCNSGLS